MSIVGIYLVLALFIMWFSFFIWRGLRKKPEVNEEEPPPGEESNTEQLRSIVDVLDAQLEQGELEEVLVFFTVKNSAVVQRAYSFRTGRTLNAINDQLDTWRYRRYAEQN